MVSEVQIQIPEELIQNMINTEIAKQLGPDNALVEAVVKAALTQKKDRYDKTGIFGTAVKKMIQEKAQDVFREWLSLHEKEIGEAFNKFLNKNKAKVIKDFCAQLASGLGRFRPKVSLSISGEGS